MSDFFDRIVARAHGGERTIQPLTASRYAPPAQRFAPADAPAEGREPADAVAPSLRSSRTDRGSPAPAPSPTEPAPGASSSQDTPPGAPLSAGAGGEVSRVSSDAPQISPPRRAVSPEAFDEDAPAPASRPTPPRAASEGPPSREPVQSLAVTGRTGAPAGGGKIAATNAIDATASEPAPSPSDARGAIGAEREDGPAQRARDLLADIYYGPADARAAAEPAVPSTLALGDWNGAGPRETTARAQPEEQGQITIAIDRIDVRGLAPPPRPEQRGRRGPRLTLDAYMRQNGRAKR